MELQKLPHATLIVVFGVISIITCCCYGIFGLIFGIAALLLAHKALALHAENPEKYEGVDMVKTGRILAIIGVALNLIYLVTFLWFLHTLGWEYLKDPEKMREFIDQYQILV